MRHHPTCHALAAAGLLAALGLPAAAGAQTTAAADSTPPAAMPKAHHTTHHKVHHHKSTVAANPNGTGVANGRTGGQPMADEALPAQPQAEPTPSQ